MVKKAYFVLVAVLAVALPIAAMAGGIPAKVYENGGNGDPVAVSGVKVEVFGGYAFKALLSSGVTGSDGGCVLNNVPLGKEVIVKLTKAGYVTQDDVRSYSEGDVENGVILWTGSEANVKGLYKNLGEAFDVKKGQVYLEINNELTGEGIEGVQFAVSSGKVFDLGQGEYLIANADGASLKVGIQKPGYTFDIESVTIPLFAGAMTQDYVKVQTGGAVVESGQATITCASAAITGHITQLSNSAPISGVTVAFITGRATVARPSVVTDKNGFYKQTGFCQPRAYKVQPQNKPPFIFKISGHFVPNAGTIALVGANGATVDFKGAIPK